MRRTNFGEWNSQQLTKMANGEATANAVKSGVDAEVADVCGSHGD